MMDSCRGDQEVKETDSLAHAHARKIDFGQGQGHGQGNKENTLLENQCFDIVVQYL